jgi:hypothetical protein
MPNSNTFEIGVIQDFVAPYLACGKSIDPFANRSRLATITNDINPEFGCDYCMDAVEFMRQFETQSIDLVLFDPPYSPRQVSEVYKSLGLTVNMQTTQASFWRDAANEVARIVKPNGHVLSFGWNSTGMGVTNGFEQVEIMLVAHGGAHNDTICLAERKIQGTLF